MLAVISPAKKLDFETEPRISRHSQPDFLAQSEQLVKSARKLSRDQLAQTMKLSDKLADLNYRRFKAFSTPFSLANAKQAMLAFTGDTYIGLNATTLDEDDMAFAQDHLRILSGLYGLLRPLDLIQPYRLEMGTKVRPPTGEDLYGFWNRSLSEAVNAATREHSDRTVVNLASNEYFKALSPKDLKGPVVTPVFKEVRDGLAKVLGLFAKRARGSMARYIIRNRLRAPEDLKSFTEGGYVFQPALSEGATWVFTRETP